MWQNCVLTLSLTLPYLRIPINHIHDDNRRFLLIGGKTVKIGNICCQPLLSFTFDLQRYQNLSLTECVSPHHYLFNILKVTASWTKDRITSDSLMATLHTAHCLLTIDGGDAADKETLRQPREEREPGLWRESFLTEDQDTETPPDAHNLTPALRSQDTGRPRVQQCTAWYTILLHYTLMQARNTVTSHLPFFLHLLTFIIQEKGFRKL